MKKGTKTLLWYAVIAGVLYYAFMKKPASTQPALPSNVTPG